MIFLQFPRNSVAAFWSIFGSELKPHFVSKYVSIFLAFHILLITRLGYHRRRRRLRPRRRCRRRHPRRLGWPRVVGGGGRHRQRPRRRRRVRSILAVPFFLLSLAVPSRFKQHHPKQTRQKEKLASESVRLRVN